MSILSSIAIKLAEAEGGEHGGITTPYSWLPEWYEIVFGGLASVIVLGGLAKFAIPALKKALAARTEGIEKDLVHAHNNKVSAENQASFVRGNLGDIEAERARLMAEADETAERVLSEGRARIEVDARELESRAQGEIAAGGNRFLTEIQANVSSIAAAATEHVVRGQLDQATHVQLIDDVIARIGASR